ncbi:hypothetical protein GOODEAATRI_024444 [Goodea atripinnis]|uniref:Tyrosine-protein kinase ephrin type A/B receptor-like domain-containing protein n=1 Tax=Goodea atripinnis TaxID=208336 RepID=A0ABV0PRA1_9TELE
MNRGSTIGGDPPHLEVFTDLPWALIDSGFGTKPVVVCGLLCKCSMYLWQTDYYYEYTECDSTGSRWRVAIPQSPGSCTGLPQPVKGTECTFSCRAGEFLEMSAQECTQCAAGSYSLGSGIRFDQWDTMPTGFSSLATSLGNDPHRDARLTCNRLMS